MNYNQFGFKPIEYQSIMCVFIFVDQTLQNYRIESESRNVEKFDQGLLSIVFLEFSEIGHWDSYHWAQL